MRVVDIMSNSQSARSTGVSWWQAALLLRGQTETDDRNIRIFTLWCFACALGFVAIALVRGLHPALQGPLLWLLPIIPIALGLAMLRSFLRFLREADEFARKVQLEGIALGFGAGQLFCLGYFFFKQLGAPELPMVFAMVPMTLGWAVGSLLVAARYR
jgi:hypothetical protein